MAFTVSSEPSVFGNQSVRLVKITADGAEANLSTGYNIVNYLIHSKPVSMATANVYIQANKNSSGAAANGTIGVSGLSAGAEIHCLVFGK